VRLERGGRIVNGVGADTDIIIASVKAYIAALNLISAGGYGTSARSRCVKAIKMRLNNLAGCNANPRSRTAILFGNVRCAALVRSRAATGAAPSPEFVFPVERALTTQCYQCCRQPCYARSRAFFGHLPKAKPCAGQILRLPPALPICSR